jgi:hypothetical protein
MGMMIDKAIEFYNGLECCTPQAKDAREVAIDTMRKYQKMQADYENRLKSDMVAMLTELQLEIEEVKTQSGFDEAWDGAVKQCSEIIQQKIDKLKGE